MTNLPFGFERRVDFRNLFGADFARYFSKCREQHKQAQVLMLLCPDYPHDGSKFTYDNKPIGDAASPTTPSFLTRLSILLNCLIEKEFDLKSLNLYPLVCEIESDLPNVLSKFANGSADYFNEAVNRTAANTQTVFNDQFPFLNIQGGTFHSGMPALKGAQNEIQQYVNDLIMTGQLPPVFAERLDYIATNRSFMFENLYGAGTYEEKYELAVRQMVNYLAVAKGLAEAFPDGCAVLNNQTPNSLYVTQSPRFMRNFLQLKEGQNPPVFNFF